jgi:hypothetical protein
MMLMRSNELNLKIYLREIALRLMEIENRNLVSLQVLKQVLTFVSSNCVSDLKTNRQKEEIFN